VNLRNIPGTDIRVSPISFGTGSIHHIQGVKNRLRLLRAVYDAGITHFDTSPYYGLGLSEKSIGEYIRQFKPEITVTTKFGLYPFLRIPPSNLTVRFQKLAGRLFPILSSPARILTPKKCKLELSKSLKRLGRDYVDFLLFHEPQYENAPLSSLYEWLLSEQEAGRVRAFGLAGTAETIAPFVSTEHPLGSVIQTKDTLDAKEAEFLLAANRPFQFTYGYLNHSKPIRTGFSLGVAETIRLAIQRNQTGSVIVSTRKVEHLDAIQSALRQ
jgi:aryl-alcohol dehydrogenase-like predicted oxidoreductase